jgi:hypothetical protein
MQPGEVNHITTAVLWARQTGGGPLGSVSLLQQYDTEVQQLFSNCFRNTGVGLNEYDILPVTVYPNPSTSFVRFEFPQLKTSDIKIEIFNSSGKIVYTSKPVKTVTYTLDLSTFASGTYLYRISDNNEIYKTDKFVVLK